MKKRTFLLLALSQCMLVAFFTSCTKSSMTADQCRITDINITTAAPKYYQYHLEYDSDKRISAITYSPYFKRRHFSYNRNYIYIADSVYIGIIESDTVTLNSAGLVSAIAQHYAGGTYNERMTYNSNNELIELDGGAAYRDNYIWKGGNPVVQVQNSSADSLKYYMNKKAADGDYFWVVYYAQYGAYSLKSLNLLSQFAKIPITYSFGVDGKIMSMTTQSSSSPTVYTYTYTCK